MSKSISRKLRERILSLAVLGNEGHVASAFSIVEILVSLFFDEKAASAQGMDFESFYLSKGHSAIGLYAAMIEAGVVDGQAFDTFASSGSDFGGHPTKMSVPPIPASTGSLGHGLPLCLGAAFARKQKGDTRPLVCLVGDGEMNEGSTWESLLLGAKFSLNNVCLIIDDNSSSTRAIDMGSFERKISAFGWRHQSVDGHDIAALRAAIAQMAGNDSVPMCIVAKTIKGYGSKETEGSFMWHHKIPTLAEHQRILEQMHV